MPLDVNHSVRLTVGEGCGNRSFRTFRREQKPLFGSHTVPGGSVSVATAAWEISRKKKNNQLITEKNFWENSNLVKSVGSSEELLFFFKQNEVIIL